MSRLHRSEVDRFTPRDLFTGSTIGGWWDAKDLSTLFTDVAGTTPVKAAAESVQLWKDKSGRGNDVGEAVAPPTWQTDNGGCVRFNGSSQFLSKASALDLYGAGACSAFASVKSNAAVNAIMWSTAQAVATEPRYYLMQAHSTTASQQAGTIRNDANGSLLANSVTILAGCFDNTPRVVGAIDNGVTITPFEGRNSGAAVTYTARTGTVTTDRFSIGALFRVTAAAFMAMDLYELVVVGRALRVSERQALIKYLGRQRGQAF